MNEAAVDETAVTIERVSATKAGVSQIKPLDPYQPVSASTIAACSNISYEQKADSEVTVKSGSGDGKAAWICVRGADLGETAEFDSWQVL